MTRAVSLSELADVVAVLAPAMSAGRRHGTQIVSGERANFATDLTTVYVPASTDPLRWTTVGLALQCSPTKEMTTGFDLAALAPRDRRALRIVEGRAAMGWVIGEWPTLRAVFEQLVPGQESWACTDAAELASRAAELAASDAVLDVPTLFGVLPGERPLSAHRTRVVGDGRRRSRVSWSIKQTKEKFPLAIAVGGPDGEAPRLVPVDEVPDDEAETSDHDRRIGIPYPEWDYRTQRYREDFVTVLERRMSPRTTGATRIDPKLRRWFAAPHQVERRDRLEDGDQIDVTAYVDTYARALAGEHTDDRIYRALMPRQRDVATAILLDATSSLQARGGAGYRLQLACAEALSIAMGSTGERFAVFAFAGETRHRVEVMRLRDFSHPPWMQPAGATIRPSGYTRLGAALRHVTSRLRAVPAERRVLLSIGDAAPSDEGYEGKYAELDVRRATDEALGAGVVLHQIALGRVHPERLERCFGPGRFHCVNRADDLPAVLSRVHEELTRT
ncbi:hypothetical protein GCM10009547_28320 [Sporichthya brevicatena]|uniref:VWFA domain-containing protein n=1 Tax=Sporichthya brevicatena TaxID=171442 RepID=A0ABP3S6W3_9ACTN